MENLTGESLILVAYVQHMSILVLRFNSETYLTNLSMVAVDNWTSVQRSVTTLLSSALSDSKLLMVNNDTLMVAIVDRSQ